jgi:hypothetical protein
VWLCCVCFCVCVAVCMCLFLCLCLFLWLLLWLCLCLCVCLCGVCVCVCVFVCVCVCVCVWFVSVCVCACVCVLSWCSVWVLGARASVYIDIIICADGHAHMHTHHTHHTCVTRCSTHMRNTHKHNKHTYHRKHDHRRRKIVLRRSQMLTLRSMRPMPFVFPWGESGDKQTDSVPISEQTLSLTHLCLCVCVRARLKPLKNVDEWKSKK